MGLSVIDEGDSPKGWKAGWKKGVEGKVSAGKAGLFLFHPREMGRLCKAVKTILRPRSLSLRSGKHRIVEAPRRGVACRLGGAG